MFPIPPRPAGAVLAVLLALALAGCGAGTATDEPIAEPASTTRTVTHAYGTSSVPAQPQRIVALDTSSADILASLGVKPVGVVGSGGFASTPMYPWLNDRPEVAEATVLQFDQSDSINVEEVAALRPDLIFLIDPYVEREKTYQKFAKIAPVVASRTKDSASETWQDQTRQVGAALGLTAEAESVINGVQARIDRAAADNPAFQGTSLSFVGVFAADSLQVVFGEDDYTRKLLAELGFVVPPAQLKELPTMVPDDSANQAPVSLERLDLVDGDALVIAYVDPELRTQLEARPGYQQLRAVTSKRTVATDITVAAALRVPTPLAVPYVLDRLLPQLSAVVR